MKALITGASSRIGVGIAERLVQDGHAVVAFDVDGACVPASCEFVRGDVRDFNALADAAASCDAGIHLAALAGKTAPEDIVSVNVAGAVGFLLAARSANFSCAVLASSAPVHLGTDQAGGDMLLPSSGGVDHIYDLSKALQEVAGRDFHGHGLPCLCVRFGHVVDGHRGVTLDEGTSLADEDYCRGGWIAIEDVVSGCVASLTLTPNPDEFEVLTLVGSQSGRDRFDVRRTELRLGMRLAFDFAEFDGTRS